MTTITRTPEQGYRDFDLPREHLSNERHYVPPRAYDIAEISRRRDLTPGTLLAEAQAGGLAVARTILESVSDEEATEYITGILAVAGINTSWYSYAQNASEMRRRLKLPIMAHRRSREPALVLQDVIEGYIKAEQRALVLRDAIEYRMRSRHDTQRRLGVSIGNVSLRLACYDLALHDRLSEHDPSDDVGMQGVVRDHCLATLQIARTMHGEVGSHPSIAQLTDHDSHLSVYLRRKAPAAVQGALRRLV